MSSARVEELSDESDPEEMDIESTLPQNSVIAPNPSILNPNSVPTTARPAPRAYDKERIKNWQCLYPIYFDASRSLSQGRRVGKDLAVHNPLARDIVDAAGRLGLQIAFEPGKSHPKDWANPGRVKVLVKEDGKNAVRGVDGKHHLYLKIAEHLRANPTDETSPLRLKIPGMPPQTEPLPPPAVPRGWKMSSILPLHSPAVTGGGVSENLFKDMMAEMQGGGDTGAIGVSGSGAGGGGVGGGGGKKKDKKKVKG